MRVRTGRCRSDTVLIRVEKRDPFRSPIWNPFFFKPSIVQSALHFPQNPGAERKGDRDSRLFDVDEHSVARRSTVSQQEVEIIDG